MFRALFKLVILLIVLVAVGGFFLGWWGAGASLPDREAVATAGQAGADMAKRAGQEISQKTADAAKTAQEALGDGALTAKIKAKMALDDRVKALDLNIDTRDGVVTVTGKVKTSAERERALSLARETNGVRQVIDRTTLDAPR
jgi:hyperosmotically inducible protein